MKKSDRAKKQTAKVIEAAARAHEALDYFNGNVTNPFDELTWPSIAEGYLLVAQKAVSDALVALERANSDQARPVTIVLALPANDRGS